MRPIVAVVAESRYAAEDGAAAVRVEYEPLDSGAGRGAAVAPGAAVLHAPLGDNLAATFTVQVGDVEAAFRARGGRHARALLRASPHRDAARDAGVLAQWNAGTGQLTLWSSTQWPHTLRDVLRDVLGLADHQVRVIAPDVGGGFGVKQEIYPEELLLPLLARRLGAPVKWIETRREHLLNSAHAREQWHEIELAARRDGTILGMRAEVLADLGAYARSLGVLCPSITAGACPVPTGSRTTPATCAWRSPRSAGGGVSRRRPAGSRLRHRAGRGSIWRASSGSTPPTSAGENFIRRDEFPWDVGTGTAQVPVVYDSGDYARALDTALALARYPERRREQAAERARGTHGRLLGIGLASYVLLTGLGPHEGAILRIDATGRALLVTGASPHGQGTATALAQIVADELGLQPSDVTVQHGDTALIPFGVGTYASRNAVVAGSAALVAARMVRDKARRLAARLLEVAEADLELVDGAVRVIGAPDRGRSLGELAVACAPGSALPDGMDPGLEATHYFPAPRAAFASGAHVAVVEVERETGQVTIVDYAVASDAGPLINPRIVEGQIARRRGPGYRRRALGGARVRRPGPAADAVAPGVRSCRRPAQIPSLRIAHLATPSPLNPSASRGVGEAGTRGAAGGHRGGGRGRAGPFGAHITASPVRGRPVAAHAAESLSGGLTPMIRTSLEC